MYLSSSSSISFPEKTSAMTYFINDNSEIRLHIMFMWFMARPNMKSNRKSHWTLCFPRDLTWKTTLAVIYMTKSTFLGIVIRIKIFFSCLQCKRDPWSIQFPWTHLFEILKASTFDLTPDPLLCDTSKTTVKTPFLPTLYNNHYFSVLVDGS